MHTQFIEEIDLLEQKHWWHIAKRELVVSYVSRLFLGRRDLEILEIGAGSGGILAALSSFGTTVAFDSDSHALEMCTGKGIDEVVCGDFVSDDILSGERFDVVIACDVLEHIERDELAAQKIYSLLKPGGVVIAHVPANSKEFGYWDTMMHHFRRYDLIQFERLFTQFSFRVIAASYRVSVLYPFVKFFRFIKSKQHLQENVSFSDFSHFTFLSPLFLLLCRIENFFIVVLHARLPFGLSALYVGKKAE